MSEQKGFDVNVSFTVNADNAQQAAYIAAVLTRGDLNSIYQIDSDEMIDQLELPALSDEDIDAANEILAELADQIQYEL